MYDFILKNNPPNPTYHHECQKQLNKNKRHLLDPFRKGKTTKNPKQPPPNQKKTHKKKNEANAKALSPPEILLISLQIRRASSAEALATADAIAQTTAEAGGGSETLGAGGAKTGRQRLYVFFTFKEENEKVGQLFCCVFDKVFFAMRVLFSFGRRFLKGSVFGFWKFF